MQYAHSVAYENPFSQRAHISQLGSMCNMCSIGTAERIAHLVRIFAFATGPDEVKQKPKIYLFFAGVRPVQLRKHRLQRPPLIELAVGCGVHVTCWIERLTKKRGPNVLPETT